MNLTKTMDKVIGRQRERQQSRHEAYHALVAEVPHATSEGQIEELRARATRRDARAAEVEAEFDKLANEESNLQRQEAAIRERMLEA